MSYTGSIATGGRLFRRVQQPLLSASQAWEVTAVQEPDVLYDAGTWKMWYTGDWTNAGMGYATCSGDPTVPANWTKYASNPVLGQGGSSVAGFVSGHNVAKIDGTYYAFYYDTLGGGNLKVTTSSDGIAWDTPTTAVASNSTAGITGWANSFIWKEGSNWLGILDGRSTDSGTPWVVYNMTSSDGLTWTPGTRLTSLAYAGHPTYGGLSLANAGAKINGRYVAFYHTGSPGFTYSDVVGAWSTDLINWTQTGYILRHSASVYEIDQVADPYVVEQGGKTYMFTDGVNNPASTSYINVSVYDFPLSYWLAGQ